MSQKKAAKIETPAVPKPSWLRVHRGILLVGFGAAVLATAATLGVVSLLPTSSMKPEELVSVKAQLAAAKTRAEQMKAKLLQEQLAVLTRAALVRDEAASKAARKELVELGPRVIAPCRELALRTHEDVLKLALIPVIGSFKEPEAAGALVDIYRAQEPKRQLVKQEAATALAKLGIRTSATGLGQVYREEKDEEMKKFLARHYLPYAPSDPMGVAKDPALEAELARRGEQKKEYVALQKTDPKSEEGLQKLVEAARSEKSTALRLAALQKLSERKDEKGIEALDDLAKNPGKDEGGLVRTNALSHLCRSADAAAIFAVGMMLECQDPALRKAALSAVCGVSKGEYLPTLQRIKDGKYPEDERKKAAQAVERIEALAKRTLPSEKP